MSLPGDGAVLDLARRDGLSRIGIFPFFTGASIARVFFHHCGNLTPADEPLRYSTDPDLSGVVLSEWGLIGSSHRVYRQHLCRSSALQFAVSVIGVLVFVGLTAYDTQPTMRCI